MRTVDDATVERWLFAGGGLAVALVVGLTIASFVSTARSARADEERMRAHGVPGTGCVSFVEDVSENDSAYRERFVHLDVTLRDGRRYEARLYLHLKGEREPARGDVVDLVAHPDRPGEVRLARAPFGY